MRRRIHEFGLRFTNLSIVKCVHNSCVHNRENVKFTMLHCMFQVPGSPRFFVTFRESNNDTPEIEEVFLDNIIKLDDCLRNPIGKGDKVLASLPGKREGPYCTGIVMDGSDERTGFPCNKC